MNKNQILDFDEIVSGKQGECYITIPDEKGNKYRYNFAQAAKIETKIDIEKSELSVLGQSNKIHKATGWKGTGSATFRYNTSVFRNILSKFKKDSVLYPFEIVIVNSDPQSKAKLGQQRVVIKNCVLDSAILAKIDVDSEFLDEDISFTFDDFDINSNFNVIAKMDKKKA